MLTARGLSRGATNAILHPKGLLREGNGLLNVGFAASSVGGAALGGLLVDLFGVEAALLVDAALVRRRRDRARDLPPPARAARASREPFLARLRSGLRYARTNRVTRLLIGGEGLAIVFFTLIVPIEIVYASETLHTDDLGYGVMLSAWGAGIVLGSVVFLGVRRRPAERAHTLVHPRHRLRLSRHGRRARAVGRVRVLDRRRARQRRPVGLGDDGAAGVDARRPPGAHHRPARVDRRPPRPASGS